MCLAENQHLVAEQEFFLPQCSSASFPTPAWVLFWALRITSNFLREQLNFACHMISYKDVPLKCPFLWRPSFLKAFLCFALSRYVFLQIIHIISLKIEKDAWIETPLLKNSFFHILYVFNSLWAYYLIYSLIYNL